MKITNLNGRDYYISFIHMANCPLVINPEHPMWEGQDPAKVQRLKETLELPGILPSSHDQEGHVGFSSKKPKAFTICTIRSTPYSDKRSDTAPILQMEAYGMSIVHKSDKGRHSKKMGREISLGRALKMLARNQSPKLAEDVHRKYNEIRQQLSLENNNTKAYVSLFGAPKGSTVGTLVKKVKDTLKECGEPVA